MDQIKLKILLENLIKEIESNSHITIDEIIVKLSLDIESYLFIEDIA